MKKNYFLCMALVAALVSCSEENVIDTSITTLQKSINFTAYAGTTAETKGTAVNSNTDFQSTHVAFEVKALAGADNSTTASDYFNYSTVTWSGSAWANTDVMYWPNEDKQMHFAAYAPSSVGLTPSFTYEYGTGGVYSYSHAYTVGTNTSNQIDLMYAMATTAYEAPDLDAESGTYTYNEEAVNLHFKHALTQINIVGTKAENIDVYVKAIKLCNIYNNGTFTATALTDDSNDDDATVGADTDESKVDANNFGTWATSYSSTDDLSHYDGVMSTYNETILGEETAGYRRIAATTDSGNTTLITKASDPLILMPQALTAWDPDATSEVYSATASHSYLAINCAIFHTGIDASSADAAIHNGWLYVPFSTANIKYSEAETDNKAEDGNAWLPGYRITYCLNFGGGYTTDDPDGPDEEPEVPGETPDPTKPTLRPITYTVTVDDWVEVAQSQDLGETNTDEL